MRSTRLPGKILMPLAGKPMLAFLIERLRAGLSLPVCVATTDGVEDDKTANLCAMLGVQVIRGSESDVFSRYQKVARETGAEMIVRLTGDNPLVNLEVIKTCVASHFKENADLTSTREILPDLSVKRYAPKGHSVDVLRAGALLSIAPDGISDFEKEHVIPVFFRLKDQMKLCILKKFSAELLPLSVDTAEDLEAVRKFLCRP